MGLSQITHERLQVPGSQEHPRPLAGRADPERRLRLRSPAQRRRLRV